MEPLEALHDVFQDYYFFDRDLSWLAFNERVLMEAERDGVPLLERLGFLSIYSSNLDEFYRVRMPALAALHKLHKKEKLSRKEAGRHADVVKQARHTIAAQLERFGAALQRLLPLLEAEGVVLHYGTPPPPDVLPAVEHYFFTEVLAFLQVRSLSNEGQHFFPENNRLYLAVTGHRPDGSPDLVVVNIPTEDLPRFYTVRHAGRQHVLFLDDIVKRHLHLLPNLSVTACHSFKVTRDAELGLNDEYTDDMAAKIEQQIAKRDQGLATRLLHEPGLPDEARRLLLETLQLTEGVVVAGGRYHNLKDLRSLPVDLPGGRYQPWPPLQHPVLTDGLLLDALRQRDVLLHTPFHAYDAVLRFFNEAAIAADVERIYLTMYRVASDSRIVNALLSAAANGKSVTVLIELKARFDEANNIKWAKRLKKAGVQVLYTPANLKVHAKVALAVYREGAPTRYAGLLATGNLNEGTARFYTDHILLTTHHEMLAEVERLFQSFEKKEKDRERLAFAHLLVAQHNLQDRFLELIDREILHARTGRPARLTIKLNNLEERVLIKKLYDASAAGVQIDLIVRGICCLVPGRTGLSENIRVRRIVDRYLEHGRVYVFRNDGRNEVYLGSADWMNRNIYHRVEVCFPLYDEERKAEVLHLLNLQLRDNVQAVDGDGQNRPVPAEGEPLASQSAIYRWLAEKHTVGASQT